jgi:nucleotide-binding universal stress UspA family protein
MFKHLFVPVDGSALSHKAMDQSLALASQLGAKVTGFVVEPDLPISLANVRGDAFVAGVKKHEMDNEAHASALLDQFAALAAKAGVEFTPHHTTAYMIDHAIMEAAERTGCDMIVMVTHGRNALGEFIFGSHTKKIISQSQLPVLVLH